jgi:hypothetical protein
MTRDQLGLTDEEREELRARVRRHRALADELRRSLDDIIRLLEDAHARDLAEREAAEAGD